MRPVNCAAFAGGVVIGTLGGLIGLGGAEFRLPLLLGMFRFGALEAVIVNKAVSLVVVAGALVFRSSAISIEQVASHWDVVLNVLVGSLAGAWLGAGWAIRLKSAALYRLIAILLVGIATALAFGHHLDGASAPLLDGGTLFLSGAVAGLAIGVVAALMGVAGGELLIPTLVVLFSIDIKLAGSLSLAISLPTMVVGFARYSRDSSFSVLGRNRVFIAIMAAGSLSGAFLGGMLLGVVPDGVLLPLLVILLGFSAIKVWRDATPGGVRDLAS